MISGEELAAYAAGEADPALVARVESALSDDPELAERLARLRTLDALLADLEPVTMTDAESERLDAGVEADLAVLGAAAADPAVIDLAGRRDAARSEQSGSGRTSWWDPMRLAGAAAALLIVVGVASAVLDGPGGGDDSAETADMAAAPAETATEEAADRDEEMVELPTEAATEGAADGSTDAAGGGEARPTEIPVVDEQRVVANVDEIDPTALRERLEPLVELGAVDEPMADDTESAQQEDSASPPSDVVGIADGRLSTADREAVRACLPEPGTHVIVTEIIILAPERPALAYVLSDRVVVVDATSCAKLADLAG